MLGDLSYRVIKSLMPKVKGRQRSRGNNGREFTQGNSVIAKLYKGMPIFYKLSHYSIC